MSAVMHLKSHHYYTTYFISVWSKKNLSVHAVKRTTMRRRDNQLTKEAVSACPTSWRRYHTGVDVEWRNCVAVTLCIIYAFVWRAPRRCVRKLSVIPCLQIDAQSDNVIANMPPHDGGSNNCRSMTSVYYSRSAVNNPIARIVVNIRDICNRFEFSFFLLV